MSSTLLVLLGSVVLLLAAWDVFITTLTLRGGGPVVRRATRLVWSGLLALHRRGWRHGLLSLGGGVAVALSLGVWVILLAAGWGLIFAGLPGAMEAAQHRPLRVATKYVETTRAHFARIGRQVEIIKLYGSMELAPLVGLADVIVDLVDTGNTLRANGLEPFEVLEDISARLVVNKAAQKMKHAAISELVELFDRGAAGQAA